MPTNITNNTDITNINVNGEDHLDGWTFTFNGGADDSLFNLTGSTIESSQSFILPRKRNVLVRAEKPAYSIDMTRPHSINIGSIGASGTFNPSNFLYLPRYTFPNFTNNDWSIELSVFATAASFNKTFLTWVYNGQNNFLRRSGAYMYVYTNSQAFQFPEYFGAVNVWYNFKIFGSGTNQMSVSMNGITYLTNIPRWPNKDNYHSYIGQQEGNDPTVSTFSKFKLTMNSIVYVQEELATGPGVLVQVGAGTTYNNFRAE